VVQGVRRAVSLGIGVAEQPQYQAAHGIRSAAAVSEKLLPVCITSHACVLLECAIGKDQTGAAGHAWANSSATGPPILKNNSRKASPFAGLNAWENRQHCSMDYAVTRSHWPLNRLKWSTKMVGWMD
jgi:hypothetical protein